MSENTRARTATEIVCGRIMQPKNCGAKSLIIIDNYLILAVILTAHHQKKSHEQHFQSTARKYQPKVR